jgi:Amt family ammonium transporter
MVPGLALFYGGLVRHKNVIGTMMHSITAIGVVSVLWVLWGYSLAFSTSVGGLGFVGDLTKFGMVGVGLDEQAFMIFQGMFAMITPAVVIGGFAERMRFSSFLVFVVIWLTVVYAPLAHWVWGVDGWIHSLGALDYAGGTVVHIKSGVAALVAAIIIGRRLGYGESSMVPHDVPMVVLGAGLLWFGWFGFNAGSALAPNGDAVNAFVVTNTAAAAGVLSWTGTSWLFDKKPSVIGAASGAVAGLVAITPAAGYVGPMPAVVIGLVAGVLCYWAVELLGKLRIDDSLAVLGVHGIGGTWGAIATGLFVGVGYGALAEGVTRGEQILYQLISVGAAWGWSFAATGLILLVINITMGLRVRDADEELGLDLSQHDEAAYTFTDE